MHQQRLDPVGGQVAVEQDAGQQGHPLGAVGDPVLAGDTEDDDRLDRRPDGVLQGQQVGQPAEEPGRGGHAGRHPGDLVGPPLVPLGLRELRRAAEAGRPGGDQAVDTAEDVDHDCVAEGRRHGVVMPASSRSTHTEGPLTRSVSVPA